MVAVQRHDAGVISSTRLLRNHLRLLLEVVIRIQRLLLHLLRLVVGVELLKLRLLLRLHLVRRIRPLRHVRLGLEILAGWLLLLLLIRIVEVLHRHLRLHLASLLHRKRLVARQAMKWVRSSRSNRCHIQTLRLSSLLLLLLQERVISLGRSWRILRLELRVLGRSGILPLWDRRHGRSCSSHERLSLSCPTCMVWK